jgi:hypothetical protein
MLASRPAVSADVLVLTAGFFEGVGQHRYVTELAPAVHLPGH